MKYASLLFTGLILGCSTPKSDQEIFSEQQRENLEVIVDSVDQPISGLEQNLIDQGLINLEEVIPGIRVELKYSTEDNFFGRDVYGDDRCLPTAGSSRNASQSAGKSSV